MDSMRITGLASGMDTESMVRDLMKAERVRVDKYYQQKEIDKWKQEQYNDINKELANFVLDVSKEFGVSRRSYGSMISDTSSLNWVKKASSSDDTIFTANATAKAVSGTHKIKVKQLAEGVSVGSKSEVLAGTSKATSSTKLSELGVNDGLITFQINVDGTQKDVTVNFLATDTIEDLVDKINSATTADGDALGIQASFDDTSGRLFLSTKETGNASQIKITSDAENLFTGNSNKFKLLDESDQAIFTIGTAVTGKDAQIDFDGAVGITYSSNQFTINGIDINLNALPTNTDTEYTIKVETDVDGVYNKIKSFVDKYNDLIDKLNKKVSEKRYRDFMPLTKEQKEAMNEDDIKLWEEKAKSGLLKNDDIITRTIQNMRNGLYETVYKDGATEALGVFSQLSQIGITTGEWKDKGKLVISDDPEKGLKAAIEKDVDAVLDLLFKPSSITKSDKDLTAEERETKRKESGLLNRLFDDIVTGMKDIVNKSGTGENADLYRDVKSNILIDFVTNMGSISYLDKDILNVEKSITREEDRLEKIEDNYWRKFTAMEKALSEMNSQSAWLMSQVGGM
ncbi:hypothetical protein FQB35_02495 [Crassaminicella thermophila]|uniref:Flagellar hook-associated protein 2 n=1 Tax=Crassaminicella thermophila TaxID=2599308 RepID=A0A5C0SD00_CRATE|nr:flagellar filament capping protein FliD [Crassaminicella thermophila]QEK11328.1 hypothetical protein FQB35_02495 [Crassaminicella thermophila]